MEFNVPVVTAGGEEVWVRCRVERDEARVKTVTVTSNPFATLAIRPWLEEAELAWAAPDTAQEPAPPPGRVFSRTIKLMLERQKSSIYQHEMLLECAKITPYQQDMSH